MADNKSPCSAFKSQALTNILKIIFEGQCRQLPAMLFLKALYPEELASAPFANYLELTNTQGERGTESSSSKSEKLQDALESERINKNVTIYEQIYTFKDAGQKRASDRQRDLDFVSRCCDLVSTLFENLERLVTESQMPYTIRATLRLVALNQIFSAKQNEVYYESHRSKNKIELTAAQLPLLASLLVGCWLNTGLRDASLFGMPPPLQDDTHKYLTYFQTCRVLFENLMSAQLIKLDQVALLSHYTVSSLNNFILEKKEQVLHLFDQIVDVPLPERSQVSSVNQLLSNDPDLDIFAFNADEE